MPDATFETIFAAQLREYAEQGVRPVDRYAVADVTIESGLRPGRRVLRFGLGRQSIVPIVIAMLLLALVVAAVMVGSQPHDRTHRVLAVSGDLPSMPPDQTSLIDVSCLTLVEFDIDTGARSRGADCADRLLVSPDGRRAAARGSEGLIVIDLESGGQTTLPDTLGAVPTAWSPRGRWLQWVTCATETEPCDVVIGAPDGTNRNTLPNPIIGGYNGSFRWSPDDRRFFISDVSGTFVGNGDGSLLERAGFEQVLSDCSPDGSRVAYIAGTDPFPGGGARAIDIYIAALDGTGARNLTAFDSESAYGAAWSPDGMTLAVVSSAPRTPGSSSSDPAELWIVDVSGGRRLVDLRIDAAGAQGRDWATVIQWSPDGSRFAFESVPDASSALADVVIVPLGSSPVVAIRDARQPAWSADGSSLAMVAPSGVAARIDVTNADGSGRRAVGAATPGLRQLLWPR